MRNVFKDEKNKEEFKMRGKKQYFVKRLFTVLLVVMVTFSFVNATVDTKLPDWKGGKRTLKVYFGENVDNNLRDKFRAGMTAWNNANKGRNKWKFEEAESAAEADIRVRKGNPDGNPGATLFSCNEKKYIKYADILINSDYLPTWNLDKTVRHELGHCLRLDDTKNKKDIMYKKNTKQINLTKHDVYEAYCSDIDPPCPLEASGYIVRGANSKTIWLEPKPGSNINLEDVEDITIKCLTGSALYTHVSGWNASGIQTIFYAYPDASYNEVFGVTLKYPGDASTQAYTVEYTGVLTITEGPAPKNSLPHAVAGNDITVSESQQVFLDGSGSYHDDSSVFIRGTWLISGNDDTGYALCGDSGVLTLPPGTYTATLIITDYYARTSEDSITITVIPSGKPEISVNRSHLFFGANDSGITTGSQTLLIRNISVSTLNWSISDDASWLTYTPTSGSNEGLVTVSADASGLAAGNYTGTITITDTNASNSPQTVTVNLTVVRASLDQPPFGIFSTPVHGSTVRSSIPVTGWVLDDVEVKNVNIYNGSNYVGDAVFVEGARPDVEQAYPDYPKNYQAGWGYMLLTYFLPNGGNGNYTLYAKATDSAGHEVTLGSKTITVDNANAVKPFGAIDTPAQGGTSSGSNYRNWGWVLTPQPNSIPIDGSTIKVYVDGVNLGHPVYNLYRKDISDLFPGYANSNGAGGYFDIDTTSYTNGVHEMSWTAVDDAGNIDGIGSRYFSIQNTNPISSVDSMEHGPGGTEWWHTVISKIPVDDLKPIKIKKGYVHHVNSNDEPEMIYPDNKGLSSIKIQELERLVILLNDNQTYNDEELISSNKDSHLTRKYAGYQVVGSQLRPLPIGSTLDRERGIFYWVAGTGFIGEYWFVFIEKQEDGEINRKDMKITIGPKFE
jgi:hypothetical protein